MERNEGEDRVCWGGGGGDQPGGIGTLSKVNEQKDNVLASHTTLSPSGTLGRRIMKEVQGKKLMFECVCNKRIPKCVCFLCITFLLELSKNHMVSRYFAKVLNFERWFLKQIAHL